MAGTLKYMVTGASGQQAHQKWRLAGMVVGGGEIGEHFLCAACMETGDHMHNFWPLWQGRLR